MLTTQVEHYLTFRRTLGFRLDRVAHRLDAFVQFAAATGDTHVRASTAVASKITSLSQAQHLDRSSGPPAQQAS